MDDLDVVGLCFPVPYLTQVALEVGVICVFGGMLPGEELSEGVLLVLDEIVELVHALLIVQLVESLVVDQFLLVTGYLE